MLIAGFLLVPLLFIVTFVMLNREQDNENAAGVEQNDSDVLGGFYETNSSGQPESGTNLTGEHPADRNNEPEAPVIDIIGVAYLTFDDGPSRTVTPGILDVLAEEGIKATFFTLPYGSANDIFWRIINEGHEIGNHSYSHDYPTLYEGSVSAFREDVQKARNFISDNFGYTTTSFRFPGGSQDQSRSTLSPRIGVINEIGYRYFDWDIDTNDWRRGRTADDIINDILDSTNGREHVIILLHDVYDRTLEALPGIIDGLRNQGYSFDVLKNHPG